MRFCLLLLLLVLKLGLIAQKPTIPSSPPGKGESSLPEFRGGKVALEKYLRDSIRYPEDEKSRRIEGTVYLSFVVSTNGVISDIKVLEGVKGGAGLEKEAVRIVSNMPKWKPGSYYDIPTEMHTVLPITFVLPKSDSLVHSTAHDTVPAAYPGGSEKQLKFIQENVRYPRLAKEKGHMGTVYIQYTVDTTGKVTDAKVLKGVDGAPELEEEALRVVKIFPKHDPARVNGRPIEFVLTYPVKFVLQ